MQNAVGVVAAGALGGLLLLQKKDSAAVAESFEGQLTREKQSVGELQDAVKVGRGMGRRNDALAGFGARLCNMCLRGFDCDPLRVFDDALQRHCEGHAAEAKGRNWVADQRHNCSPMPLHSKP